MKNLYVYFLLGLLASAGFAQVGVGSAAEVSVACDDDECHIAPVFMGEGGFVGKADDGVEMVKFVVKCGLVVTTASVEPDNKGVVRQLFTMANGLACNDDDGGTLEIEGLMDGGWYWINDNVNSAVSSLVAKDILSNTKTMPTDPGGVMLTRTDYGTFVKHETSGRVGIIPHILPAPEVEPEMAEVCRPAYSSSRRAYVTKNANCMLGNGRTMIALTGPAGRGRTARITNGMVTRSGDGTVTVAFSLWGNGSGHLSDTPLKGWDMRPRSPHKAMSFPADFGVRILDLPGVSLEEAGITLQDSTVTMTTKKRAEPVTEVSSTVHLENGIYMVTSALQKKVFSPRPTDNTALGVAEGACKQAVDGTKPIWQAADGKAGIKPSGTSGTGATNGGPSYADDLAEYLGNMQTWVRAYNGANARAIRTAWFATYSDTAKTTIAKRYEVPLVVCEMVDATTNYRGSIDITSPSDLCRAGNNTTAQLQIYAPLAAARNLNSDVVPPLAAGGKVGTMSVAAIARLDVKCAPASANRGQELVPGNTFPVSDR